MRLYTTLAWDCEVTETPPLAMAISEIGSDRLAADCQCLILHKYNLFTLIRIETKYNTLWDTHAIFDFFFFFHC